MFSPGADTDVESAGLSTRMGSPGADTDVESAGLTETWLTWTR